MSDVNTIFTEEVLTKLFPKDRADSFFEALFGDAEEGAYDIALQYITHVPDENTLHFELHLTERPGKCLACNLTYGLPEVFSRHPILNIKGLVADINSELNGLLQTKEWSLKGTRTISNGLHVIPLVVSVE
ncbi:MAG: pancreas/duodenum homeobox protein 1 [Desulfobulbaceae bacterium]|uniref:Pancreas/duodenum homeobox protein 1 n=1 Tax=Candidatus Desulfobia pelagia TaxID=2841692 RepID=A0A8J6NCC7_9BACT|nr:pancreas/duodenum homeobox protein 1 [Candidatus Desulfobia pelagia]